MDRCVICGKETNKTLFRKAIVHTHICSKECLLKYYEPLGKKKIVLQETLSESIERGEYWIE